MTAREEVLKIEAYINGERKNLDEMHSIIEEIEKMGEIVPENEIHKMVLEEQNAELDDLKANYHMRLHELNKASIALLFAKIEAGMI